MAIIGRVDSLEGHWLTGWAINTSAAAPCRIVVENDRGLALGQGQADRERGDLASLGHGRSDFAFRIRLPPRLGSTLLRIRADGFELWDSPFALGRGLFDGHLEVRQGRAIGWLKERVDDGEPPAIELADAFGHRQGPVRTEVILDEDSPFQSVCRFEVDLDQAFFGRADATLYALAGDACIGEASADLGLAGSIDLIDGRRCAGRLHAPQTPLKSFELGLYSGSTCLGVGSTAPAASDASGAAPAFAIDVAAAEGATDQCRVVSLRLLGSDLDLFDGPFVLAESWTLIAAARAAARLAHGPVADLGLPERAVLQAALGAFIAQARRQPLPRIIACPDLVGAPQTTVRLCVIIPVYRGVEETRTCIRSVLDHRDPGQDRVVIVNDCSPDPEMAAMLEAFAALPLVSVSHNAANLGFVGSVNRALRLCPAGDVLLLNADTRVFAGAFDELLAVLHAAPDIATVTALSSNATIFSYPQAAMRGSALPDVPWATLAAVALRENRNARVDVPTAHGFCMLIRRTVLDRLKSLNPVFGRGYGEENEFCLRAADLGYRHVAAGGVLVEHRESLSFGDSRDALRAHNLRLLTALYPDYMPSIVAFEERDGLRSLRWSLDRYRLAQAVRAGRRFVLVVENWLGGGSSRASQDIERELDIGADDRLSLRCLRNGMVELSCANPPISARFDEDEAAACLEVVGAAAITGIVVSQLLGFTERYVRAIEALLRSTRSLVYVHDYYPICPRVNLTDPLGAFCKVPDAGVCARCVAIGGAHGASRMDGLSPAEHRKLFGAVLAEAGAVVVPSKDTAAHLKTVYPALPVEVIPHPDNTATYPSAVRPGRADQVVLIGAIRAHKGSRNLLRLVEEAYLYAPQLHFHVVGDTDIDPQLKGWTNLTIHGAYRHEDLGPLLEIAGGRVALFLHDWPETFSYTLSEAAAFGLLPVVPDIGAPAERVRAAGFGVIVPFPVNTALVLRTLQDLALPARGPAIDAADPSRLRSPRDAGARLRALFGAARRAGRA